MERAINSVPRLKRTSNTRRGGGAEGESGRGQDLVVRNHDGRLLARREVLLQPDHLSKKKRKNTNYFFDMWWKWGRHIWETKRVFKKGVFKQKHKKKELPRPGQGGSSARPAAAARAEFEEEIRLSDE